MITKFLAISNIIGFMAVVVTNYLAVLLPIGGKSTGELSDLYPNLFVPAGFTFSIWGFIYILLLLFVVWQILDLYKKASKKITEKIGIWFLLSCMANIGRIFAWHYEQMLLSVIVMLLILITLIIINIKIDVGNKLGTNLDKIFVQIPFNVYLGWICVATIANVSTFLVNVGRNMRGMTDVFRTIAVIIVATLLALIALLKYTNIPFALVIIWAFIGIIFKRVAVDPVYSNSIIWTLGICIAIISGFIGWSIKNKNSYTFKPIFNKKIL